MADQEQMLDKVDIIRNRFGVSYREAYDVLERSQGNVVRACMMLEEPVKGAVTGMMDRVEQQVIQVTGQDLYSKLVELVRLGQNSRIAVRHNGKTIFTIPTAVGAIGALFFPYLTVAATAVAVTAHYEIVLDKRKSSKSNSKADIDDFGLRARSKQRKPGITNVHHEERETFIPVIPSMSSGKEASLVGAGWIAQNRD